MKAAIRYPAGYSTSQLHELQNFRMRLLARNIVAELAPDADLTSPSVEIEGQAHEYGTLVAQSLSWGPLRSIGMKRLRPSARLPTRGSFDCAGLDLYADIDAPLSVKSGETVKIPTGIALQLPTGYYAQIKDRSGMGAKGFAVRGGVIDRDYRGEIVVMLQYVALPNAVQVIDVQDRVAQLTFVAYLDAEAVEVQELGRTVRDQGGFGSTGA